MFSHANVGIKNWRLGLERSLQNCSFPEERLPQARAKTQPLTECKVKKHSRKVSDVENVNSATRLGGKFFFLRGGPPGWGGQERYISTATPTPLDVAHPPPRQSAPRLLPMLI